MLRKSVTLISLALLVVFALVLVLRYQPETLEQGQAVVNGGLSLPTLSDASYDWIGSRIYQNEAMGKRKFPFSRELYIDQEDFRESANKKCTGCNRPEGNRQKSQVRTSNKNTNG